MSNRKQHSSRGWIGPVAVAVVIVAAAAAVAAYSGYVRDSFNYYSYHPDTLTASFVTDAGMNEKGKFFLYTSHARVEAAQDFNMAFSSKFNLRSGFLAANI